jgi:two-component system response regulator FlrC
MKDTILTADPRLRDLIKQAEAIATSRATVLLCGESGTGKELLARYIHSKSQRSNRRLVAVNCAAVPDGLLESELFGFERGAFTGAVQAKPGKFELANDGTLLLDEISELPLPLQGKLLRAIQEGEIERLGARHPIRLNFRLIAATNRDLAEMVRQGRFRADLYYRLNVMPLFIPPLRDRPNDIDLLARAFAEASADANARPIKTLSPEAMTRLQSWSWPGNIRELQNVIERAVLLASGTEITLADIRIDGAEDDGMALGDGRLRPGLTVWEAERQLIMKTLEHTRQNRTRAAELLGISIRTLRNKLSEYRSAGILVKEASIG